MKILKNMNLRGFPIAAFALSFSGLIMLSCVNQNENSMTRVVQLKGIWKFSVGDDSTWSEAKFDDSAWDEILVPSKWEEQGYNDYNGYAWYRRTFRMSKIRDNYSIYFLLGRIDDVDEAFINGKIIGCTGSFPPNFETAFNQLRKYRIPNEYLNFDAENSIAVRVYDSYLEGGIIDMPAGIYINEDADYLNMSLEGTWKFNTGDNKDWMTNEFNDSAWVAMNVPSEWENEGFSDYDGYAWYRKNFELPSNLKDKTLYLSLGKIDDYDYVYLNGVEIGNVFELDRDGEFKRSGFEYNARRIYKIPADLIKENGQNLLAVRVYDKTLRGGIYEGPIGIMTRENYKKYRNKHNSHQSLNDFIIDEFIDQKK